jgi:hypothetical protein
MNAMLMTLQVPSLPAVGGRVGKKLNAALLCPVESNHLMMTLN